MSVQLQTALHFSNMQAESQRASLEREMKEKVQKAQNDVSESTKCLYTKSYRHLHLLTYVYVQKH